MIDGDFYNAAYDAAEAECKALRAENDRLREALEKAQGGVTDYAKQYVALRAENDRLREALERFNAETIALTERVEELRKAAEAENDRLREALTWMSASTMKDDAPKGCEYFLVFRRGGEKLGELAIRAGQIGLARYVPDDRTGWRLETDHRFGWLEPTHWAKIPTPPKAEEEEA